MTTERRAADRRISPAIGEHAILECARLRQELKEARAQATEDHAGMLVALGESMRLRQEVEQWHKEAILNMHKIITCGVAATHPDPNLTNTGAYKSQWDSPQAESVRKLREALAASEALLSDCRDSLTSAREKLALAAESAAGDDELIAELVEALKNSREELSESIENEGPFASFSRAIVFIDAALAKVKGTA